MKTLAVSSLLALSLLASSTHAQYYNVPPVYTPRGSPPVMMPLTVPPQQNFYYYQTDNSGPKLGTVLAGTVVSGLFEMAAESERYRDQMAMLERMAALQKEANEKPIRMMWGMKFRTAMRARHEPEWQINHWLRDRGVDPAELEMWEAALSLTTAPPQAAVLPPTTVPQPPAAPLAAAEREKLANAGKVEWATKIRDDMVREGATPSQIDKRLRSFNVDPSSLPAPKTASISNTR